MLVFQIFDDLLVTNLATPEKVVRSGPGARDDNGNTTTAGVVEP